MRHVGFIRPVQIGKGQHGTIAHHEVVEMPVANADALMADHPNSVVDLTPKDFGFPVSVPRRLSTLRFAPCPACTAGPRMTICSTCGGAGKVMVV